MVHVFAANSGIHALAMRGIGHEAVVFEASLVVGERALGMFVVAMVELSVLHGADVGGVCLRQDLSVLDGLHCAVVVVLVDLLVDGCVDLLVLVRLDCFLLYGWRYFLVHRRVVVA